MDFSFHTDALYGMEVICNLGIHNSYSACTQKASLSIAFNREVVGHAQNPES